MSNRNIGAGSKRFTPRRNVGTLPPGLGGINKDVGRKVALFGTGMSGKSTFFRIIADKLGSDKDYSSYNTMLYQNILVTLHHLIKHLRRNGQDVDSSNKAIADQLASFTEDVERWAFSPSQMQKVLPLCAELLPLCYYKNELEKTSDGFLILTPIAKYLENAPTWITTQWTPTIEDVVLMRVKTTGIVESQVIFNQNPLAIIDTGGERSERRKWIHVTSDVIIFTQTLTEYLCNLYEDDDVNRMTESFNVYKSIQNSFQDRAAIYVVLTHEDEFHQLFPSTIDKFKEVNPDFTGSTASEAIEYLTKQYQTLSTNIPLRGVYTVNCLDLNNAHQVVDVLFADIEQVMNTIPSKKIMQKASLRGKGITDSYDFSQYIDTHDELDLSKNKLISCSNLSSLTSLTHLDLSSNSITDITALLSLVNLTSLVLTDNQLTFLPSNMSVFTALKLLDLSKNKLTNIDPVCTITSLSKLYINANSVTELPVSLVRLKELSELEANKNPLVTPPKSVVKSGLKAILNYLESLSLSKTKWNVVKCVIVGKEGVGKTHLTKRLKGEEYKHNISTDGIDISMLPAMKCKEIGGEIKFNVFDFGGQEVFYPTHMFYLQSKGVYVVVYNIADPMPPRIEYWLRTIRWLSGATAQILLVGTHLDAVNSATLEQAEKMAKRFKRLFNVAETLFISNKTKKGLSEFKEAIISVASRLTLLKTEVPYMYEVAANRIRSIRESGRAYLEWNEYKTIMSEVSEKEDQLEVLSSFLNDVGMIIWFNQPQLRELVIIDPQWLAEVMASIVSFKARWSLGVVPHSMLPIIWKQIPPSQHQHIMAILERFEILFPLKGVSPPQSVAPCMLPPEPTKEFKTLCKSIFHNKDNSKYRKFVRSFCFDFLPIGFFPRLVVRAMHSRDVKYKAAWINGAIIEETEKPHGADPDMILLEYDPDKYILNVTLARSPTKRSSTNIDIFTSVVFAVTSIVDNFYTASKDRLTCVALCSVCMEQNKPQPHEFTDDVLIEAFTKGSPLVTCPDGHKCPISDIAPDISFSHLPIVTDVQIDSLLAKGGFGKVYKGTMKGKVVAIKELHIDPESTEGQLDKEKFREFYHEIYMMAQCDHPNLVRLYGVMLDPLRIVMEYAGEKDLLTLLQVNHNHLPWKARYSIALDIARAMAYLHSLQPPIIHRDLRSPNVFITSSAGDNYVAKVGDLGLAAHGSSKLNEMLATWTWLTPEVFSSSSTGYDERSDVYSYAMILWNMACPTSLPFAECVQFLRTEEIEITEEMRTKNPTIVNDLRASGYHVTETGKAIRQTFREMEIKRAICNDGLRPAIPDDCPVFLAQLINECWDTDPQKRPAFSEIVKRLEEHLKQLTM